MSIAQALLAAIPIVAILAVVLLLIILFNKMIRIEKKLEKLLEEQSNSSLQ
ncbi:hypothetical protein [Corynebacterium propinquum]